MPQEKNLTMLCDFYELTMANGCFRPRHGRQDHVFRRVFPREFPTAAAYAIAAGLEQIVGLCEKICTVPTEDIAYLRGKKPV